MIGRLLFSIARSPVAEFFIGQAFASLTPLMPLRRIAENRHAIVFAHPKAHWERHWLAVPKQRVASILVSERDVLNRTLALAQAAARQLPSPVLLVNAGNYQDVPQLHFHLISGRELSGALWDTARFCGEPPHVLRVTAHPQPIRTVHWQVCVPNVPPFMQVNWANVEHADAVVDGIIAARAQALRLRLDGFTILWHSAEINLTFHLLSGQSTSQ